MLYAWLLRLQAWHPIHSCETAMAEESGIYAEDIVKNSQGIVGLVVEDAEETSDESDSEEESLKKGQIVVCWYPSGHEETLSVSKVHCIIIPVRSPGKFDLLNCFEYTRLTCNFFNIEIHTYFSWL